MSAVPFLEVRDLVKDYPGVRAVDHVSFEVSPGEVLGLVGKNGAGKSTVIKVLAGAVFPNEGEIFLDGEPLSIRDPHDATLLGLSFVHQELSVVPELSVAENVELGLGYPKRWGVLVDWDELRARSLEVLDRLESGIDPRAPVGSLSVAHQRLAMIARAFVTEARLVVLDEPSAALTDEEVEHLFAVVRSLASHGVSVIYVTHRLDEIFEITDRVIVMRDGAKVADRPTSDYDSRTLIEEITGADASSTGLERRRSKGIGARADAPEVLRVEGIEVENAVHHADFNLHEGEILGIAGLIGAGRTELVRALFGADRRRAGKIFLRGREVRITKPKQALSAGMVMLPEDRRNHGLVQNFTVRRNITLGTLARHRVSPAVPIPSTPKERRAANHAIDVLDIKTVSDETPAAWLSGGSQQKLVLARWIDSPSDVLIFDEPTHGIDVGAKEEVYSVMEELASAGKGVIFISSEFGELVGVCHRVIVMREGRLVAEVSGDDITERRLLEHCYGHDEQDVV
jgi:ABC-type sugar transport system ATPase subunit